MSFAAPFQRLAWSSLVAAVRRAARHRRGTHGCRAGAGVRRAGDGLPDRARRPCRFSCSPSPRAYSWIGSRAADSWWRPSSCRRRPSWLCPCSRCSAGSRCRCWRCSASSPRRAPWSTSVAAPALVPALVPRAALAAANGRLELARSVAYAAGPALAGALVGWAGASAGPSRWRPGSRASRWCSSSASRSRRVRDGTAALRARAPGGRGLRVDASVPATHLPHRRLLELSWFVLQAAYVPYAVHGLGMTASSIGTSLAAYGVGMLVGALLAARASCSACPSACPSPWGRWCRWPPRR